MSKTAKTIPQNIGTGRGHVNQPRFWSVLGGGIDRTLNFVLPHICLLCKQPHVAEQDVCAQCWPQLSFITDPACECCGLPFAFEIGAGALCVGCLEYPKPFAIARSALRYDDAIKPLILAFKHGDRTHLRLWLGKILVQAARPLIQDAEAIIPVPLHWSRLLKRRYNQSALLAGELSRYYKIAMADGALRRVRRTVPHENMTREERQRNVKHAFLFAPDWQKKLRDKTVVLVDDVFTTGATVGECARVLYKGGVAKVGVVTIARVCRDT